MSDYVEYLERFRYFKLWTEVCVQRACDLIRLINTSADEIQSYGLAWSSSEDELKAEIDIPVSKLREIINQHYLSDCPTEFYKHLLSYHEQFSGVIDDFIQLYEIANADNLQPKTFDGVTTVTAHQTILNMAGYLNAKYSPVSTGSDCHEVADAILSCRSFLFMYDILDVDLLDRMKTQFTLEHVRAERWAIDNFDRLTAIVSPGGQGSSANSANSQEIFIPGNPDLTDLCKRLKDRPEGVSQNSVAKDFLKGTGKNWQSLIQQARKPKYRPLWDPEYKKKP